MQLCKDCKNLIIDSNPIKCSADWSEFGLGIDVVTGEKELLKVRVLRCGLDWPNCRRYEAKDETK